MPIRARFGDRAKSGTFVVFASRSEEGSVLDVSRSPYEHDEFSDAHCLLFVRLSPWYVTSLRKSRNAPVPRGKRSAAERTRRSNFPPEMNERLLSCTSIVISFFRSGKLHVPYALRSKGSKVTNDAVCGLPEFYDSD